MKIQSKKTFTAFITAVLLTAVVPMTVVPEVKAPGTITTSVSITWSPFPVSVGQQVLITVAINPPRSFYINIQLTVTAPDGSAIVSGTFNADSSGMLSTTISATQLGSYDIAATFPGEYYVSNYYTPSSKTATIVVSGLPDFSVSASPASQTVFAGQSTTYTVICRPGGYAGVVTWSASGLPTGATASFNPTTVDPNNPNGSTTLTASTTDQTPAGTFTLTIEGTGGEITRTTTVTLIVSDFSVSASPTSQSVSQGQSASYSVSVTPEGYFSAFVSLSVSGLPAGATRIFDPSMAGPIESRLWTSTLTVATTGQTSTGTATLTITGTTGGLAHSTTVTLVVSPSLSTSTPSTTATPEPTPTPTPTPTTTTIPTPAPSTPAPTSATSPVPAPTSTPTPTPIPSQSFPPSVSASQPSAQLSSPSPSLSPSMSPPLSSIVSQLTQSPSPPNSAALSYYVYFVAGVLVATLILMVIVLALRRKKPKTRILGEA